MNWSSLDTARYNTEQIVNALKEGSFNLLSLKSCCTSVDVISLRSFFLLRKAEDSQSLQRRRLGKLDSLATIC